MDFFEAQALARKRTRRLALLFALAVLGTVLATYAAAILLIGQIQPRGRNFEDGFWSYQRTGTWSDGPFGTAWWDPRVFAAVALCTLAVIGIASLFKWMQFSRGGGSVAESVGGRRVDSNTTNLHERRLLNVVEEMAIASGIPVPAVYVLPDEPAINAFAAGLTTSDAAVAVTRGTIEKLSRDELQGVVAHEFSHILNGDMRLNVRLSALVFGILVLGLAGRGILHGLRFGRVRSRGKGGGGVVFILLAALALLVIGYIGYFFGRLIQAAVSRQREFLADASAVQFTRNPTGIAGALKKIGGYALGSTLQSGKSAALGHFFFSQGFRSGITGLWSTHPPLDERIRAIDPAFDGKMFDPPQVVDVSRESFRTAGFGGGMRLTPDEAARQAFSAPARIPATRPQLKIAFSPAAAMAAIGTMTPEHIARAQRLLDEIPTRLGDAARSPGEARLLVCGLLLDDDPAVRARQRNLVSSIAGAEALAVLNQMEPLISGLGPEQRLPLLQLALPALRGIAPGDLEKFLGLLDELVHVDEKVSTFEFALQKLLVHSLALGRHPGSAMVNIHAFTAVVPEISLVLSALAGTATRDAATAPRAFEKGAAQLTLIADRLRYRADADFAALDAALDKLATASLPIKQRTLTAAAHVVNADGQVLVAEFELLRAIAAALDCPMPPVGV